MKNFHDNRSFKNRALAVMVAFAASLFVSSSVSAADDEVMPKSAFETLALAAATVVGNEPGVKDTILEEMYQGYLQLTDKKEINSQLYKLELATNLEDRLQKNPGSLGKNTDIQGKKNFARKMISSAQEKIFGGFKFVKTALKNSVRYTPALDSKKIAINSKLVGIAKTANGIGALVTASNIASTGWDVIEGNLNGGASSETHTAFNETAGAVVIGTVFPASVIPDILDAITPDSWWPGGKGAPTIGKIIEAGHDLADLIVIEADEIKSHFSNHVSSNIKAGLKIPETLEEMSADSLRANQYKEFNSQMKAKKEEYIELLEKRLRYANVGGAISLVNYTDIKNEIRGYISDIENHFEIWDGSFGDGQTMDTIRKEFARKQIDAMYGNMLQEMGISAEAADRLGLRKEYDARIRKDYPLSDIVEDIKFGRLSMEGLENIYMNLFQASYDCRNAGPRQCLTYSEEDTQIRKNVDDIMYDLALEAAQEYNYEDYGITLEQLARRYNGHELKLEQKIRDAYDGIAALEANALRGGVFDEAEYTRLLHIIYDDYLRNVFPEYAKKQGKDVPDEPTWTPKDPIEDVAVVVPEPGQEPKPTQPDPVKDVAVAPDPEPAQPEPPKNTELPKEFSSNYSVWSMGVGKKHFVGLQHTGNAIEKDDGKTLEVVLNYREDDYGGKLSPEKYTFKSEETTNIAGKSYYQADINFFDTYGNIRSGGWFRVNPAGDFYTFLIEDDGRLRAAGYSGKRSVKQTILPTKGISTYSMDNAYFLDILSGNKNNKIFSNDGASGHTTTMFVNWGTNKVYGIRSSLDDGPSFVDTDFFIGHVDRDSLKITGNLTGRRNSWAGAFWSGGGVTVQRSDKNAASLEFYGDDYPSGVGGIFNVSTERWSIGGFPLSLSEPYAVSEKFMFYGHANETSFARTYTPDDNSIWKGFATGRVSNYELKYGEWESKSMLAYSTSSDTVSLTLRPSSGTLSANISMLANNKTYTFESNEADTSIYVDQRAFAVLRETDHVLSYVATAMNDNDHYDYLSWGEWRLSAVRVSKNDDYRDVYDNSYWIAGSLTPAENMPKSGAASYTGVLHGSVSNGNNGSLGIKEIYGVSELKADFSNGAVSGMLEFGKHPGAVRSAIAWSEPVTVNLDAVSISGNQFKGNLNGENINFGKIYGAFYGPQAQELGGNWIVRGRYADRGNKDSLIPYEAVGIFSGKQ